MEVEHETPLVEPRQTYASVTDHISSRVLERRTPWGWYVGMALALLMFGAYGLMLVVLLLQGPGIFGLNIPVGWGFPIVTFVWWIGIGHAGTFISAVLLLMRARWRTSINRFAEAITLVALVNAALLPLIHLGRPWLFFYMLPYPNSMGLWPQFRSPLIWDLIAILNYFIVSLLFWYMGLIPDLATLRDRATGKWRRRIYGALSLGWVGSAFHWRRYEMAQYLMAALITPLVISVHSIVDIFAYTVVPGWHATISPPFFVVGAIFSGFAMVLALTIPLRDYYRLEAFITDRHLDNLARFLLGGSLLLAFGYLLELFGGWYTDDVYEEFLVLDRLLGPHGWMYFGMIVANVLVPQLLWSRRVRSNKMALFFISLVVLGGMWLERFVIVSASLARDFLPSSWGLYWPTFWDGALFVGSLGFFFTFMFLFIRVLPVISIAEVRELIAEEENDSD